MKAMLPMQATTPNERDAEAVRMLITRTFMEALRQTELAPMDVLEYAVTAIGLVYRDVAEAHTPPRWCPCGWQPDILRDIAILKSALAAAALPEMESNLARAEVVGHA